MKLTRLDLDRSRGLDAPYSLVELSPSFNVIVGSNGSGKSSICRAIAGLLWNTDDFHGSVKGEWLVGDERCSVLRESGAAPLWNAESGRAPGLPEDRFRGCFSFSVDDFLTDEKTDEEIQRVIRTELLAGFDLTQVLADRKHSNAAASSVSKQKNELVVAAREAEQLRGEHRELLREERQLAEQSESLEAASEAHARSGLYRYALQLADKRVELSAAQNALALFPESMTGLRGDEQDLLQGQRDELERAAKRLKSARQRADQARAELDATGLEEPVPEEHLSLLKARERELLKLQSEEREATRNEAQAVAAIEGARRALPSGFELRERNITSSGLEDLEALLAKLSSLEQRRIESESRAAQAEGAEPLDTPYESGIALLARWLEGGSQRALPGALPTGLIAAGCLFALLGALGQLGVLGTFLSGAVLIFVGVFLLLRGQRDERETWVRDYLALPLDPPAVWDADGVSRALAGLQKEAAKQAALRFEVLAARKSQHDLLKLDEQRDALMARLAEVSSACGVDPECAQLGLLGVARQIRRHNEAMQAFEDAQALKDEARAARARELSTANQLLESHGFSAARDAEEVRAFADALQSRERQRATAARAISDAAGEIEHASAEHARREEALAGFFESLDLAELGERELLRQLDMLADWRQARERRDQLQSDVGVLERALEQHPDLAGLDPQQARAAQQENEERSGDYDRLNEEVARIRIAVDKARGGHELSNAMAEEESCREALADTRDALLDAAAAEYLLEGVGQDHQNLAQPDILRNAARLFSEFTRHRYELSPASYTGDGLPFEIRETQGPVKLVKELSSGTRSQLGLALRLAVAQSVEQGEMLPILLDEALTNSDPERFGDVVRSLNGLTQAGRQIFFFTSDPLDAQRLESLLQELGAETPRHIDLNELRQEERASETLQATPIPDVPTPADGESATDYAERLDVARIDAFAGVDALHLFYLCSDDLDGLREVLVERVSTVGETRSLLAAHPDVWCPERRERFEARRTIAAAWLDHFQIGRAPRLAPEVLREGPAGKGKYIEALVEINAELDGDAMALMRCIDTKPKDRDPRLKGFQKAIRAKLCDDLEEHGLHTPDEPLSIEERLERCLAAAQFAFDAGTATREDVVQLVNAFEQWVG